LNNQSSDKSVAEVIMKALLAPQVGTGLQSEWTALLRLASEGDVLALRSLLVAMESGNNVFLRIAARAILAQLVESGVVLTPGRLESVGAGENITDSLQKTVTENPFSINPYRQMLYGYTLERRTAEQADVVGALHTSISRRACFESWSNSRRSHRNEASSCACALLPDEVTQAAIADVTSWTSGLPSHLGKSLFVGPDTVRFDNPLQQIPELDALSKRFADIKVSLLRAGWLWGVGADVESSNGSTARKLYSNAVSELSEVSIPLDLQEQLLAWHSKLMH